MDIVDALTRSRMMSGIKSKNTKPEMLVRQFLHARGFRYRLHDKKLPAKPDLVLPRYRVAILVHGCFWHRHAGCRLASVPSTNVQKWSTKFESNRARDVKNISDLVAIGMRVIVIWECGLRGKNIDEKLAWLSNAIKEPQSQFVEWPVCPTPPPPCARLLVGCFFE